MHRAFDAWWEYALQHYIPMRDGRLGDWFTNYYDPVIDYNHKISLTVHNPEATVWHSRDKIMMTFGLTPQRRDVAYQFFEAAAETYGWNSLDPADEPPGDPRGTLYGLAFAREFGDDRLVAKLKACAEERHGPTLDPETLEFTCGFGLKEPHPRGQFNANAAMAEAMTEGAWWRLFNEPNLRKFIDPTVYAVDFPTVCLSQAIYDEVRRTLVVATDVGVPAARGKPTTFKVTNIDPQSCTVIVDGEKSNDRREVDGDIEISTTVGAHTFLLRLA